MTFSRSLGKSGFQKVLERSGVGGFCDLDMIESGRKEKGLSCWIKEGKSLPSKSSSSGGEEQYQGRAKSGDEYTWFDHAMSQLDRTGVWPYWTFSVPVSC
jgi:hypothetical protein